jgi:hypothetical protein
MTTEATAAAPTAAPAAAPAAPVIAAAPAAPAAVPAPVATSIEAPAAPAAPAPAAAAPAAAVEAVSYEPTGDASLDFALDYIGKLGINPADPAMVAAEAGNFALLEAKLALMGDKAPGWERIVALGKQGLQAVQAAGKAKATATEDAILSVFGNDRTVAQKQWGEVVAWAKENAEPAEREAVNAALAAGGIAAKAMASYLAGLHAKHPSATKQPAAVTKMTSAADTSAALSPAEYKAEVGKLRAKYGNSLDGSPEYKVLQARRMAWRG